MGDGWVDGWVDCGWMGSGINCICVGYGRDMGGMGAVGVMGDMQILLFLTTTYRSLPGLFKGMVPGAADVCWSVCASAIALLVI